MALVINTDTLKTRTVKNLGWLLRNWKQIESFNWLSFNPSGSACDGFLVAHTSDGRVYLTRFASAQVCIKWLARPVFASVPIIWDGRAV